MSYRKVGAVGVAPVCEWGAERALLDCGLPERVRYGLSVAGLTARPAPRARPTGGPSTSPRARTSSRAWCCSRAARRLAPVG